MIDKNIKIFFFNVYIISIIIIIIIIIIPSTPPVQTSTGQSALWKVLQTALSFSGTKMKEKSAIDSNFLLFLISLLTHK